MFKLNMTMVLTSFVFVGCSSSLSTTLETKIDTETSSSPASTSQEAVDRHNEIRAEVFSGADVIWSEEIATTAQEYANYLAVTGKFEHDTNSGYGENLYASSRSAGYVDAINRWYDEKKDYTHATNGCTGVCGHYTQIVWKDTTEIGCATATYSAGDMNGGSVVICRYNPPGNYVGRSPY